jgi:hypothetical protein
VALTELQHISESRQNYHVRFCNIATQFLLHSSLIFAIIIDERKVNAMKKFKVVIFGNGCRLTYITRSKTLKEALNHWQARINSEVARIIEIRETGRIQ